MAGTFGCEQAETLDFGDEECKDQRDYGRINMLCLCIFKNNRTVVKMFY